MGRSTTPLRLVVKEYTERLRRTAEVLPPSEKELVEKFLEDVETTLSACMHTGVVDPMEVFMLHFLRRMKDLCKCK